MESGGLCFTWDATWSIALPTLELLRSWPQTSRSFSNTSTEPSAPDASASTERGTASWFTHGSTGAAVSSPAHASHVSCPSVPRCQFPRRAVDFREQHHRVSIQPAKSGAVEDSVTNKQKKTAFSRQTISIPTRSSSGRQTNLGGLSDGL
eukprot:3798807-Rhodomonas_salina.1